MCVCPCVHEDICRTTRTIFAKFFVHVAYGHHASLLRRGDIIPKGRGNLGIFFLVDNALYSIAFGTHTKTAEPIEMLFGMMNGLGPWNSVLHGMTITTIPKGEWAILGRDRTNRLLLFRDRISNCTNLFRPKPNRTTRRSALAAVDHSRRRPEMCGILKCCVRISPQILTTDPHSHSPLPTQAPSHSRVSNASEPGKLGH